MSCNKYQDHLPAYVDGELSGRQLERIETHLQACAECRDLTDRLKKSLQLYAAVENSEPAVELSPWLAERIAAQAMDRRLSRRPFWGKLAVTFGVVLLMAGIYGGYAFRGYFGTPRAATPAQNSQSIRLQGEGIGVEIGQDRFVLHAADKRGRGEIDLKL